MALVRDYGQPNEVAARFQPRSAIIDPADSPSFLRAAIMGAGVLLVLGAMSMRRPSPPGTAGNLVQLGILFWLGALVALIYLPSVGIQLYSELGRLYRAAATPDFGSMTTSK